MINSGISNINNMSKEFKSLGDKIEKIFTDFSGDYHRLVAENAFSGGNSAISKIAGSVIADIVLLFILFQKSALISLFQNNLTGSYNTPEEFENVRVIISLVFWIIFFIMLYNIYNTGVLIYNRALKRYEKRFTHVQQSVTEGVERLKDKDILKQIIASASLNASCDITTNNDVGEEIVSLKRDFENTNKRAGFIKKIINIGASVVLYLFLIIYMFAKISGVAYTSIFSGMTMVVLCIAAAAVINIIQLNVGEYIGIFAKPAGYVMAIIYGICMSLCMKSGLDVSAFDVEASGFLANINKAYILLPLLQTVGIILSVCLSHYGLEKERWENGYQIAMAYGEKVGSKSKLLKRGGVAIFLTLLLCLLVSGIEYVAYGFFTFGFLWHCANCLIKPRGSYLYAFWGRWKCIAHEVIMGALVLSAGICGRGSMTLMELALLVGGFAASFVVGGIAKFINNRILL